MTIFLISIMRTNKLSKHYCFIADKKDLHQLHTMLTVPHNQRRLQESCTPHLVENSAKRRATSQKTEVEAVDGVGIEGGGETGVGDGSFCNCQGMKVTILKSVNPFLAANLKFGA